MKADFTRLTFKREKHYNGVRMQQGRVQTDADWNEQADIQAHLRNTQSTDVIGACGAPRLNGGFEITAAHGGSDLLISPGRMYVDGILCENEPGEAEANEGKTPFTGQLYNPRASLPEAPGLYAVYLDVWERHITAVEDDAIREVALNGPDTATRTRALWQVKLMQVDETNSAGAPLTCWDTPSQWTALLQEKKGLLSASTDATEGETGPCIISAGAGYRRLENQLYRVEIHTPGAAGVATFKWSRDNGVLVSQVQEIIADRYVLVVSSTGKDDSLKFGPGQWVEVTDEYRVLQGEPGFLFKVKTVEENTLVLDIAAPESGETPSPEYAAWENHVKPLISTIATNMVTVRRWEQSGDGLAHGTVPVPADTAEEVALEDGIQVRFHGGDANYAYSTGDYWLIPARTVRGDVEWPRDDANNSLPQLPHGIYHHYCKLALVDWDGTNFTVRRDCRPLFPALNEPDLYYISGDGQEAMPGDRLPQPLKVGVSNCNRPVQGAWVKFELDKEGEGGDGYLSPVSDDAIVAAYGPEGAPDGRYKWFIVATDGNGEAECIWKLRDFADEDIRKELPELPAQQVRATLLREPDDPGDPESRLDRPVVFSASFGVAWEDRYGGSVFPDEQHGDMIVHTVEDAIDQLRQNVSLQYVSGDGQEAKRGGRVKMPLQVRAANGDWPFNGAKVKFEITEGGGSIAPEPSPVESEPAWTAGPVEVETDPSGLAKCVWKLDENTPAQQVTATLVSTLPDGTDNFSDFPGAICFNAELSIADEVTYDGSRFPETPHGGLAADTVETAIDQLRENVALYYVSGDGQEIKRSPVDSIAYMMGPVVPPGPGPVVPGPGPIVPGPGPLIPGPGPIAPVPVIDMLLPEIAAVQPPLQYVYVTKELLNHLQVRAANGDWPFQDAVVRFRITEGKGDIQPVAGTAADDVEKDELNRVVSFTVKTDAAGLAECRWRLDPETPGQQVTASLVKRLDETADSGVVFPSEVRFNATLSTADNVSYSAPKGKTADTVQAALDDLYATKVDRAGDTITGSLVIEGDLTVNGTQTILNTEISETEDNIIRVNKYDPQDVPKAINGGLEVFRGGSALNPNAQLIWDETQGQWKLGLENNYPFVASKDGKVGIGTDKPYTKLHIVTATGKDADGYGNPWVWGQHIEIAASQMWGLTGLHGMLCTWDSDSLFIGQKDEGPDRKDAIIAFGDNSNDSLKIIFTPPGNPAPQPLELMRITGDGKVGIGKQPEKEKLEVNGNVKADKFIGDGSLLTGVAGTLWEVGAAGDVYYNSGKVGIGTPSPGVKLQIEDVNWQLMLRNPDGNNAWRIGASANQWAEGGGRFMIGQSGTHRLTIDSAGKVGIGTTDPKAELHVNGQIYATGAIFYKNTLADISFADVISTTSESFSDVGLSATVYVPGPTGVRVDMISSRLSVNAPLFGSGGVYFQILRDNQVIATQYYNFSANADTVASFGTSVNLTEGSHVIKIQWRVVGVSILIGQITASLYNRKLLITIA